MIWLNILSLALKQQVMKKVSALNGEDDGSGDDKGPGADLFHAAC